MAFLARGERVSAVDHAWLRMDSAANLMMIIGVMMFSNRIDAARLAHDIEMRLLSFRRFRSRVAQDVTGASWEEVAVDMDYHLQHAALPAPGGKVALEKLVAQLAAQPLDPARPLWQIHLVENYDGGSAVITRIHHCIADGIALIGVLLSLTTNSADADPAPRAARKARHAASGPWELVLRPLTEVAVKAIDTTGALAVKALQGYQDVLANSSRAGETASEAVRVALQVSKDAAGLALMDNDTTTSLKGVPEGTKAVAWCDPLPLADVKGAGKALGCSVNDVLLSCVAGAIRSYLLDRGETLKRAELRAMVPVNLRGPSKGDGSDELGNRFGLVPVLLPIGIAHPIERVLEVRQRMGELKGGYTALMAMGLLGIAGMLPHALQRQMLDIFGRKTTAVMTNVPGPQHPLYLAGAALSQIMFWVPQTGNVGVGVSILSYNGGVQFGLITDRALCAEPQQIIERFKPEFENLVYALLLAPWDENLDAAVAEKSLAATETAAAIAQHMEHGRGNGAGKQANGAGNGASEGGNKAANKSAASAEETAKTAAAPSPRKRKSAFSAARHGR